MGGCRKGEGGFSQCCPRKHHQRARAHGHLLRLELGQAPEGVAVETELEHVENLVVKGAGEGDGVRALLAAAAEEEQAAVVLFREEGERAGIFERMDCFREGDVSGLLSVSTGTAAHTGILLLEALGVYLPQGVEVAEGILGL